MSDLEAIRQRTEEKKRKLEEIRRKKLEREAASAAAEVASPRAGRLMKGAECDVVALPEVRG